MFAWGTTAEFVCDEPGASMTRWKKGTGGVELNSAAVSAGGGHRHRYDNGQPVIACPPEKDIRQFGCRPCDAAAVDASSGPAGGRTLRGRRRSESISDDQRFAAGA